MKTKNLIILTLLTLCFAFGELKAQEPSKAIAVTQIEALKGLEPLDPFKVSRVQGESFDPQAGPVYFEDGKLLPADAVGNYLVEIDYIAILYVNPIDRNKVVAMLVRKATPEEREAQKAIREKMGMPITGKDPNALDMSNPEALKSITFDPNLKKDEFIKGLKKLPPLKTGGRSMNIGRVACFDEYGKLIPSELEPGKPNPAFNKYLGNKELSMDVYADEKGLIKALVYRKATLEEKKLRGGFLSVTTALGEGGSGGANQSARLANPDINSEADNVVGTKAKEFSVKTLSGEDIQLAQYKGKKVVVLNFWFTRCKPCGEEMPHLNKLVDQYKGQDVEFISICLDNAQKINDFLKKNEFKYKIVPNGTKLANEYNIALFPTHIVIDKKSKIVFFEQGYTEGVDQKIKAMVDKNLQ